MITRENVRDFLAQYLVMAPNTYRNHLKSLRVFLRDYLGLRWIESFKFPSLQEEEKWVPTDEEVKRFYDTLRDNNERALYVLFATTGLRRREIRSLDLEDVDFKNRAIRSNKNSETKRRGISFYNEEAEEA